MIWAIVDTWRLFELVVCIFSLCYDFTQWPRKAPKAGGAGGAKCPTKLEFLGFITFLCDNSRFLKAGGAIAPPAPLVARPLFVVHLKFVHLYLFQTKSLASWTRELGQSISRQESRTHQERRCCSCKWSEISLAWAGNRPYQRYHELR